MPTVQADILEGAAHQITADGHVVTRVFQVTDLAADAASVSYAAYSASGIPQRGEFHPSIANLVVDTLDVVIQSPTQALVKAHYKRANVKDRKSVV